MSTNTLAAGWRRAAVLLLLAGAAGAAAQQALPSAPREADPASFAAPASLTNFGPRFQLPPLEAPDKAANPEGDVAAVTPAMQNLFEGLLLVQDGDYTNAVPVLEKTLAQDPSLLGGWEALGWSYWNLGEKEKAEQTWNRLMKLAPGNPLSYNLLAQVATTRKDLEKAEGLLRQSLERDPKQFDTRLHLGLVLAWQARTREAHDLFLQLVREEPDRLDVRIELAHAAFMLQQYEDAAAQWKIIAEILPDNPDHLIEWARNLLYSGELEEATAKAQRAAELDNGSLRALNVLADIAEIGHRPEVAIPEIRKLLDKAEEPLTRSQIRSRLVNLMRRLYDRDPGLFPLKDMIAEARAAIDEDPRNVNMQLFLAEVYVMDRRYEEAEKLLRHVLDDINPMNFRARRSLFELHMVRREFDRAASLIDQIYEAPNADQPYRFADLARLEYARGNYAEAVRLLDRMERESMKGSVLTLAYGNLALSDWEPGLPVRLFRDHILFLQRAGYRFVRPDEVLPYFESRKTVEPAPRGPAPYRFIRWLRYAFTGQQSSAPAAVDLESFKPDRVACLTFDGALRNSFSHATPVAEEFDVPFAMHIPVGNIARREFGVASWADIRAYQETGLWTFGSHGLEAAVQAPGFEDGYRVSPLPNRLWLDERKRLESLREWSLRVKDEMQKSRAAIVEKLELDPTNGCRFFAYPFGEIGQMEASNIESLGNVPVRIVNEASMAYRLAYIQSLYGYATPANNPLVHGRYRPADTATGQDVLSHALRSHPAMVARRLKAELAALQGKPHLAYRMLELLDRDGYPSEDLRKLREYVDQRISGQIERTDLDQSAGKAEKPPFLSKPYAGGELLLTKANRQIEIEEYGVRAGLHVGPALQVEAGYKIGTIDQEVESNQTVVVERRTVSRSSIVVTGSSNGEPINRRENTTTIQTVQVDSNQVTRSHHEADYTYGGGRLSYRFRDGSLVEVRLGVKEFDGTEEEGNEFVGGLAHVWKPAPSLDFSSSYIRDLVPSARRIIRSDSVGMEALWRPRDWWEINAAGRYSNYSDTNAMLHLKAGMLWLLAEEQNIYGGFIYEMTTVDEASDYYWDPYWEERLYFSLRMTRIFPTFYAGAEVRVGMAREDARPEDLERWKALNVLGENEGFYPGDKPGSDWEPSVGLSGVLRRMIGRHLELELQGSTSFYSDYSEYALGATLLYHF